MGGRVSLGPTAVGVVLAVLVVASTTGAGVAPIDSAVTRTQAVTAEALDAVGVDVRDTDGEREPRRYDESAIERAIQRQVNDERATVERSPLQWSVPLQVIARAHSSDMARNDFVSHESSSGNTTAERFERFGHDCEPPAGHDSPRVGENLARIPLQGTGMNETTIAREIVAGWTESESHRQTLLARQWGRAAVGVSVVSQTGGRVVYVTQTFC
jgi:uncharacterized protein YkwD